MNDDWSALLDAAYGRNAGEHSLDEQHRQRFRLVRTEEDGSVVVEVERHPSLFGQPTLGMPSAAFVTVLGRYRIPAAAPAFELVEEIRLGVTIDVDLLATHELENLWEALGDGVVEAVAAGAGESVGDVCADFVKEWALEAGYESDELTPEESASLFADLRTRLAELLVERVKEDGD